VPEQGESWQGASYSRWDSCNKGARDSARWYNVVMHEFCSQVKMKKTPQWMAALITNP